MNSFNKLNNYSIPTDLIIQITRVYKMIGKNEYYDNQFKDNKKDLLDTTINKECFYLSKLLSIDLSDNKIYNLLNQKIKPKNNTEKVVVGLKKSLYHMQENTKKYLFNSSDLLSLQNNVYGDKKIKFNTELMNNFKTMRSNTKTSRRFNFDKVLDEYTEFIQLEKFEKIMLSMNVLVEAINIKPYDTDSEIYIYFLMYNLLIICDVDFLKFTSFFEILYKNINEYNTLMNEAIVSFNQGYPNFFELSRLFFKMIEQGYSDLENQLKLYLNQTTTSKTDNIENTIINFQSNIFTKNDIKDAHPYVSESTINRALNNLKDSNLIKPLGTGRSAKWLKTLPDDDYRKLIGE